MLLFYTLPFSFFNLNRSGLITKKQNKVYPDRNTQAINKQVLTLVLPEEEREAEEEKIKIGRSEYATRLRVRIGLRMCNPQWSESR